MSIPPPPPGGPIPGALPPAQPLPIHRYGGLAARVFAWIIDWIVLQLIGVLILFVVNELAALTTGGQTNQTVDTARFFLLLFLAQAASLAYYTFYWSTEGGGQSIGDKVLGLRVARPNGEMVGPARAFARACAMYLSIWLVFMPVIASMVMILVTERRQAIHDLISDTVMLKT